jgi:2-oxoisovalerate dehydrogenase E1 component
MEHLRREDLRMAPPALSPDLLLGLYRRMLLIRRCEERLARSHAAGLIHGACHTSIGQEAVAVGVSVHLRPQDTVFSTHRGHGHALARGILPEPLFAELYGRATGCSQGRGGSMHLFAPEVGLMGTSGIVAASILQAAGAGLSYRLLGGDAVAVAYFGDGAVNNGAFHEGLNLAGVWKLPVLFVCENNEYATEIPFRSVTGNPTVAARATAYALPGVDVDGNDVLAVHEAAGEAVRRARSGGGATLLECRTYRTRPHAEGMGDFNYRTREEVEAWKTRCPIRRLRDVLLKQGVAGENDLNALETEVAALVEAAHRAAEAAPWPDPTTAARHVYAEPVRDVPPPPAETGDRLLTWTEATREALAAEMAANPRIVVLGEGIGKRGGNFRTTTGLFDIYGAERLRDTPISERGFVGLAGGAAMTGTRPVVDFMFVDFLLDAVGEILNQITKMQYMSSGRLKMPILLRGCVGIGHSAATHHSGNYYALFAHCPGLRVVIPSNPYDAKGLLYHALRCDDPVLFLEHRELLSLKGPVPEQPYEMPFGQARLVRQGTDVTVVALARMVPLALEASALLEREGISVELIDPRTAEPLDGDAVARSVAKTGRLLIVDEAFGPCGIGAEIAAVVSDRCFRDLKAPIRRLNGLHTPTPYSPPLEGAVVPNLEALTAAIRGLCGQTP